MRSQKQSWLMVYERSFKDNNYPHLWCELGPCHLVERVCIGLPYIHVKFRIGCFSEGESRGCGTIFQWKWPPFPPPPPPDCCFMLLSKNIIFGTLCRQCNCKQNGKWEILSLLSINYFSGMKWLIIGEIEWRWTLKVRWTPGGLWHTSSFCFNSCNAFSPY